MQFEIPKEIVEQWLRLKGWQLGSNPYSGVGKEYAHYRINGGFCIKDLTTALLIQLVRDFKEKPE